MIRSRVASAAALLLLAWAALWGPAALAQTSSPSPSPSGSGAAPSPTGSASPSASPAAQTEALALLVSAEPSTVVAGEETVLVAQVTNTGTATLASVSLTLSLPEELELVSSFPDGTGTGDAYTIALGPLDAGESAVAQATALALTPAPAARVLATATGGTAAAEGSVPVEVVVEGGGTGGLTVESRARRVLSQVGEMVHYDVTVSNEGVADLEDSLVVDVAPMEIDVVSVDLVDEVEAVQIGESGGRHDIVWNVGSLPAGSSVTLPWDGRAVRAGDLKAVNSVRGLVGTTEATRSASESFLAEEGPQAVANPHFEPIEERVVTFVDPPPSDPDARAATQPGVVLPLTGVSISRLVVGAVLLLFGGLLLLVGARLAPRASRKAIIATVLVGLAGAACVSGGGDDPTGAAGRVTPRTFGTDDPRDDEEARVKGERIVRGEDEDEDPPATPAPTPVPPATPAPSATPAPPVAPATATPPPVVAAPATGAAPAPDPAPLRVVRVVETTLEDLPVQTQGSRTGNNTVSFGWDEAAGGITSATSGTRFVRDGSSDLFTDLTAEDGTVVNRITLRNLEEATRLRVHGRLVHEVYEGTRLVARLRSEPLDVVLAPGGQVSASFSFLVPTGQYTVQAAFESA